MATIRRAGFGSVFEVENEKVGIGTTGNQTNNLQVLGRTKASDASIIGFSTLTTYQGFVDNKAKFGNALIDVESQAGTLGDIVIEGDVTVSSASTFTSSVNQLTLTDSFSVPTGNTDSRIHCHTAGSMRFNEDLGTLEFYTGDEWKTVNSYSRGNGAGRAVIAGGNNPNEPNGTADIDYLNISSLGNSINFGQLTDGRFLLSRASSETRGLFAGGDPGPSKSETIDYITIASEGDAIDFGNLADSGRCPAGASSSTRGLFLGEDATNAITFVEISTLGNSADFGDLSAPGAPGSKGTATSSPTRYIHYSGSNAPAERIDFGSIASKGNSVRFGDHILGGPSHQGARQNRACSNSTRAVFGGGYIDISPYGTAQSLLATITMASEGNAIAFGDLTIPRYGPNATSNQVRGVFAGGGGGNPYPYINVIDYIIFSTSGGALEFGDLSNGNRVGNAVSDSHGGLGGF